MFAKRTSWPLAPNRLATTLESVRAAGAQILDLSESNPTRCGLHYDAARILAALADPGALEYHPTPKGLLSAREAVAAYYRDRNTSAPPSGSPTAAAEVRPDQIVPDQIIPEQVILTASTSEAYSFIFRLLCDPGDEILVPVPSYPLFEFLATLNDVNLVPYSLLYDHGWQIDFHSLQNAISPRSRAILVVHPNNPTGSYVKPHEVAQLNQICAARDLAIVADEVFLDYAHDGRPHVSFTSNRRALTFTLSGLSKISALPQMKLAWIATTGPAPLVETALSRLEVIADTYLSLSTPVQLATPVLLDRRHEISQQLLERIHTNVGELDRQLAGHRNCQRLEVEGGWYTVLRVPATRSDEDLAVQLLETEHVLVHPGHFYDFPADGYLIISLIPDPQIFAEGTARLFRFLAASSL